MRNIHCLTPQGSNYLRVDLGDVEGRKAYAKYNSFEMLDSYTQYTLVIGSYTGTAGDSLSFNNMMKFSTKDRDNDADGGIVVYHVILEHGGLKTATVHISMLLILMVVQ